MEYDIKIIKTLLEVESKGIKIYITQDGQKFLDDFFSDIPFNKKKVV